MNRLDAELSAQSNDDLHDIVLEALYVAAAWDDKAKRDAAYRTGAAALEILHGRATKKETEK